MPRRRLSLHEINRSTDVHTRDLIFRITLGSKEDGCCHSHLAGGAWPPHLWASFCWRHHFPPARRSSPTQLHTETGYNTDDPAKHYLKWKKLITKGHIGASLVAQWLRICLPMQGTRVRALGQEDPICRGATKPVRHNYWACTLEPWATTTEARVPRARALQQEKPPKWEARALPWRVAPAHHN